METSENIKSYYQDYIGLYEDESDSLKQFKTFIDKTASDQLFDRKNFVGHITGSAIIFDYKNSKVLLIKHLQRWLQPGGHIEKTDSSIPDGVYREIREETGIAIEDFRELKNGCYIFSVASSDDELELEFTGEYEKQEVRKHIFKYSSENTDYFFLVNDGNAVNFIYNTVMGDFIHLVRAETILLSTGDQIMQRGKSRRFPPISEKILRKAG